MAKLIKAIRALAPRIVRSRTVEPPDIVKLIEMRTGYNESTIHGVLLELRAVLDFHICAGEAVKLPGLGTFAPKINREDGKIGLVYWPERTLMTRINTEGKYVGKIQNKDMIGKTAEEIIAYWNELHPDDPVDDKLPKPEKPKK